MLLACSIVEHILKEKEIIEKLLIYPNSTIYPCTEGFRYVEYKLINNNRKYILSNFESNVVIDFIIKKSFGGISFINMLNLLINEFGEYSKEELDDYLLLLQREQILVTELEPSMTGEDYLYQIEICLEKYDCQDWLGYVRAIKSFLNKADKEFDSSYYGMIEDLVKQIGIEYQEGKVIQVDLFKRFELNCKNINGSGKSRFEHQLKLALKVLNKLSNQSANTSLKEFKKTSIKI